MRDIGGIITRSGRRIAEHVFVRSNLPLGLSEAHMSFLLEKGLHTVIDLRSDAELALQRSDLSDPRFDYHHIPLTGADRPKSEEQIAPGYLKMLGDSPSIASALTAMAYAPAGSIFHCAAGKDRSGVLAMILLLLADAYTEDIIADYQLSYVFIQDEILQHRKQFPDLPTWVGQSKMEYMEQTLSMFKARYETIETYLEVIGLSPGLIARLLIKLFGES